MRDFERTFKALGQATRLKIIMLLSEQELCVCELEEILGISQSAASQHMRILKASDLVIEERRGQWVFYSLNRGMLQQQFSECLTIVEHGLSASTKMTAELQKLKEMQKNPIVECRLSEK